MPLAVIRHRGVGASCYYAPSALELVEGALAALDGELDADEAALLHALVDPADAEPAQEDAGPAGDEAARQARAVARLLRSLSVLAVHRLPFGGFKATFGARDGRRLPDLRAAGVEELLQALAEAGERVPAWADAPEARDLPARSPRYSHRRKRGPLPAPEREAP
jgi:hypothetical protein